MRHRSYWDCEQRQLRSPRRARGLGPRVRDPPARRAAAALRRRPPALLDQGPARERAAARGRRRRSTADDVEAIASWDADGGAERRDPLPARPGADAGLHRRARASSTWPRCATRWRSSAATRRRSTRWSTSTWSSTTRSRSTPSATRAPSTINAERDFERNRERYAFLRWGQQAFDNFRVVPPATGICHQVNLEYLGPGASAAASADGAHAGLSRHPGRHRLAHDDDQRPRRARLGGRRDRGRGGDARPADLDAAAAGGRLQARRRAARGRDRDRPRPDRHRDAARARRRLQVRRVLRPGAADARPRRPGDDRQHVAGVRLDLRDLPGRRRDAPLPRVHRAADRADRAGRRLRPRAGHVPRADSEEPDLLRHARARPRRRRAEHRRAEAPAGPDPARRGEGGLPRGDGGVRPRGRPSSWATAATRRSTSPSRPPTRRPRTTTTSAASRARYVDKR